MKIDPNIESWLLEKGNPSIRYRVLTELLDKNPNDPEVIAAKQDVLSSEPVKNIFTTGTTKNQLSFLIRQ